MDTKAKEELSQALHLLNQAAKDQSKELLEMLNLGNEFLKEILENNMRKTAETYKEGREKAREIICKADKKVHKHPWRYIVGVAAGSYLLGLAANGCRSHKKCA